MREDLHDSRVVISCAANSCGRAACCRKLLTSSKLRFILMGSRLRKAIVKNDSVAQARLGCAQICRDFDSNQQLRILMMVLSFFACSQLASQLAKLLASSVVRHARGHPEKPCSVLAVTNLISKMCCC